MIIIARPKEHKYNCLFLPGLPGTVKRFNLFDDITSTGGCVYWLQYSGAYDNQNGTKFTTESSILDINNAIRELSEEGLPILVVGYSYSTMLIDRINFSKYPLIFGMAIFSPIRGLDRASIAEDFSDTLSSLIGSEAIDTELKLWHDELSGDASPAFQDILHRLAGYNFPVMVSYSLGDTIIKASELRNDISIFRKKHACDSLLVLEKTQGYHKLDSYYDADMGDFFRALGKELNF